MNQHSTYALFHFGAVIRATKKPQAWVFSALLSKIPKLNCRCLPLQFLQREPASARIGNWHPILSMAQFAKANGLVISIVIQITHPFWLLKTFVCLSKVSFQNIRHPKESQADKFAENFTAYVSTLPPHPQRRYTGVSYIVTGKTIDKRKFARLEAQIGSDSNSEVRNHVLGVAISPSTLKALNGLMKLSQEWFKQDIIRVLPSVSVETDDDDTYSIAESTVTIVGEETRRDGKGGKDFWYKPWLYVHWSI
jgi:hypothetical protein